MSKKKIGFIPSKGRYLIRVNEAADVTPGGIVVVDTAKERPMEGEIVAVGPIKDEFAPSYFLKDKVLFGKYAGIEVVVNDELFLVVDEEDILGKRQ